MRERLIKYALIGFLLGMVLGNLAAWLPSTPPVSPALAARAGSTARAILIQTLVSGLYGAITLCGVLFYEIDRWPLAKATCAHFLLVAGLYAVIAWFLGWAEELKDILLIEGVMFAAYFLIWLIMWFRYKTQVRKLNELLIKSNDRRRISE